MEQETVHRAEESVGTDWPDGTVRSAQPYGRVALWTALLLGGGFLLWRAPVRTFFAGFTGDSSAAVAQSERKTAPPPSTGNKAGKKGAGRKKNAAPPVKTDKADENPFPNRFKAPSLDGGSGWLNTAGEISLKDLRGKIVLLDFWTYCCINCMHVLPDLKYLEKKYPRELVVIGVHSAKFDNEKEDDNIRQAILRYEIEHPVINDSKMIVWRKFGARAWPTVVVIDPEGNYCGYVSGEGNRELLDLVIKKLIAYHRKKGTLDESPVRFRLERHRQKPQPLKFPGKVLADEKSNRLFIADTGHNRIVITTLDGQLIDIIGRGTIGARDGSYEQATFDHPQGMALAGDLLYVADTENHLIRAVHLKRKTVSTLAGTGRQARRRYAVGKLREVPLNSPWDLIVVQGTLYICMAGPHQIWSHKLGTDRIEVFSGTGREDVTNGPHFSAAFAQPSGMTTDGKSLYIADSEGSAIRKVPLDANGRVTTLVGTSDLPLGRSLFEFGDRDGYGADARLQHPLGIVYHQNRLYVADSYNHKIRRVEFTPKGAKLVTWLGDGTAGDRLQPPRFSEPAGLSVAGGKLYIADTNNHRICTADLKTASVRVLQIGGLKPPEIKRTDETAALLPGQVRQLPRQMVRATQPIVLRFPVTLPAGYKLNADFPHRFRLQATGKEKLFPQETLAGRAGLNEAGTELTVQLPASRKEGIARFRLSLTFGYCRGGKSGLCKLTTVHWQFPLHVKAGAGRTVLAFPVKVGEGTENGLSRSGEAPLKNPATQPPKPQ